MLPVLSPSNPLPQLLHHEHVELADLVCGSRRPTRGLALLWHELERASLMPSDQIPRDVVRIGSQVFFTDLVRREARMVMLSRPDEVRPPVRISVTSTLGAALIGLKPGDRFEWRDADGAPRVILITRVDPPLGPRLLRPLADSAEVRGGAFGRAQRLRRRAARLAHGRRGAATARAGAPAASDPPRVL